MPTTSGPVIVKRGSVAQTQRERAGLSFAASVGSVPTVLAQLDDRTLILSWHAGSASIEAHAVEAAGAWLRALHQRPHIDDDSLSVPDALARRLEGWSARARDPNLLRIAREIDVRAFEGLARVWCHRDFTPNNWLWNEDGGLTIVDFGQARPDLALWDLVKLEATTFADDPALRRAFRTGYGTPTPREARQLEQLVALHGLQTAVWGDEHHDEEFSALGRRILASM